MFLAYAPLAPDRERGGFSFRKRNPHRAICLLAFLLITSSITDTGQRYGRGLEQVILSRVELLLLAVIWLVVYDRLQPFPVASFECRSCKLLMSYLVLRAQRAVASRITNCGVYQVPVPGTSVIYWRIQT